MRTVHANLRQRRFPRFRSCWRSISLKNVLQLKKTTPHEETPVVENKPSNAEDDGRWSGLHFYAIQSIVRHASHTFPQDFRKILFKASLLNKHWKMAIDAIVEKLDLRRNWQMPLDTLLARFSYATRLRLTSIDGEMLMHLTHHTHLQELELCAVDFSSLRTVKSLKKLKFLNGLKFRNSPSLDDRTLRAVACCSNLTRLDLTGCSLITGEGLKILGSITSLVQLYLGDCSALSVDGLVSLSSLSRLETLNLSGVHDVGDSVLHSLSGLSNLTDLDIFMCPNVSDVGLWYLAKQVYLRSLNLFSCDKITDEGLRAIAQQTALRKLNLGWCCLITDYGISFLCDLDHLCELRLSCVPITSDGLNYLSQLTSLGLLDVRGCDINPTKLTQDVKSLKRALPDGQLTVLRT